MKLTKVFIAHSILLCSFFWTQATFADVKLGTYSAFTESESGMAFELLNDARAVVTTEYSYDYDEHDKRIEQKKTLPGKWTSKDSIVTRCYPSRILEIYR